MARMGLEEINRFEIVVLSLATGSPDGCNWQPLFLRCHNILKVLRNLVAKEGLNPDTRIIMRNVVGLPRVKCLPPTATSFTTQTGSYLVAIAKCLRVDLS